MLWTRLVANEFQDAVKLSKGVCAIPIGCTENHGIHLPLGCDTIWGATFTQRAAELEPVCVFPEMYFGEKSGAGEYPGTIIFPTTLIWQILEASCNEIARNGFHKIVLMSSHGGNKDMLNAFARQILQKNPNYQVYVFQYGLPSMQVLLDNADQYPYLTEEDISCIRSYVEEGKKDGHGGFVETSCCYDACPEDCRLENRDKLSGESTHLFKGFGEHSLYTPFEWMGNYPNSLGCSYHDGINERIAKAIGEMQTKKAAAAFKFLKEETVSSEYHAQWLKKQK